jgi:hypothetical protein
MSDPVRAHHLNPAEMGPEQTYVAQRFSQMRCDGGGIVACPNSPLRAPMIIVPSKTPWAPGHTRLRMRTTLHFCQRHHRETTLALADIFGVEQRARMEWIAKRQRPIDFVPDFDQATLFWELVTTPEYREFLLRLERGSRDLMRGAV